MASIELRAAAQQALEAMSSFESGTNGLYEGEFAEEISALRAALVEDAMQKFTDVNQELEAALGCEHCNQPLYAAVKCRVCGRAAEPTTEDSSEVEPVAWMHTDAYNPRVKFLEWRENEPGYRGDWIKTPLYAAPPRRDPLTEEALQRLTDVQQEMEADLSRCPNCGGPADNGHDRSIPPSPYWCTKCMAEHYCDTHCTWADHAPGCVMEERNFCPRCGKRTNDIHTCTPPAPLTDEVIADLWHQNGGFHHHFARAIERWLKGNP